MPRHRFSDNDLTLDYEDYIVLFLVVLAALFPLAHFLNYPYLFTDDFYYSYPNFDHKTLFTVNGEPFFSQSPYFIQYFYDIGRPTVYLLTKAWLEIGLDENGITFFKSIALALHCTTLICLYYAMRSMGYSKSPIVLGLLLFSGSPTISIAVSWLTMSVGILTNLLATVSFLLIHRVAKSKSFNSVGFFNLLVAAIIQLIAFFMYQPSLQVFWVCLFFLIFRFVQKHSNSNCKKVFLPKDILCFFCIGLFAALVGVIVQGFLGDAVGKLTLNPFRWLNSFVDISIWSMNHFTILPNNVISIIIGVIIFFGLKQNLEAFSSLPYLPLIGLAFCIFMIYAPLVFTGYKAYHRVLPATRLFYALLFGIAFINLLSTLKIERRFIVMIAVAFISAQAIYSKNNNFHLVAKPAFDEYRLIKNECGNIKNQSQDTNLSVVLIKPPTWMSLSGEMRPKGLDLSILTSSYTTYAANMFVAACFSDKNSYFPRVDFTVVEKSDIDSTTSHFGTITIDLNKVFGLRRQQDEEAQ